MAALLPVVVSFVAMGLVIKIAGSPNGATVFLMFVFGLLGRMAHMSWTDSLYMAMGVFGISEAIHAYLAPRHVETPVISAVAGSKVMTSAFGRIDPSRSFRDKVDHYLVTKFKVDKPLEELHVQLGMPEHIDPLDLLHSKQNFAVGVPVFLGLVFLTLGIPVPLALIGIPIGFALPTVRLRGSVTARQKGIMRNFSTMVDLAALTIESGLDYMQAFEKIIKVARTKTELEKEMERMLNEVSLGYTRREALTRFSERTGLQEIRSFVGLIIQSDEMGTSLVDLLRNYGSDLRYRRLQNAEKAAAQASTKMLIPMFVFIFPVVFIAMLAPMVMQLLSGGMGF